MAAAAPTSLDPAQTALVLIEFQNEFTTAGGKLHDAVKDTMAAVGTLANAAAALQAARAKGACVLHAPISFASHADELSAQSYGILAGVKEGEAFKRGSWGAEFCGALAPAPGEVVVQGKSGLCGFHSTNLQFLLGQRGIRNVVLCGFLTNCCVESTMRAAYEHGYNTYTLTDACAATSQEQHAAAVKHTFPMFSRPVTHGEFVALLGG